MSAGPVATATVRVIPDTTGFRAELKRQIEVATAGITADVRATAAAGAGAAAAGGIRGGAGASSARAAQGVNELAKESNFLRGSLIGLSRVTPVTVFGLGAVGTVAIGVGYAIKGAIRSTADFEHQLNVFQATTSATAAQMELIQERAKQLGADLSLPSTSAGDAALAMTELAKAGLTVNDTLAGSRGVLQLAAAAQLDVGSAAQFVATELNAFGLAGDQATHVADLLTGASIAAQGEIRDFGTAFQQVSAVAKQADVSIETTTGALTELAKAGLRGADGGTSLRTALLRLTPTTKQAAQFQKALGIELNQNKTIGQQLPDLLDQYKEALAGLTPVMRQQALTQIFGQDAYRAAAILIEGGSAALQRNTDAANQNGAANRVAQANAKGLSGAFNGLKSNLDTLGITLGDFVKGPLEAFVRGTSDGVTAVGELAVALGNLKLPDFLGGGGGKGKGDSGPVAAVKRLFTPLGTVVSDVAATVEVFNRGGFIKAGETPKQALARLDAEEKAQKGINKAKQEGKFGHGGFLPSAGLKAQIEAGKFGISDLNQVVVLTAKQKKARDAIRAIIEGDKKPTKLDLQPPNRLEIPLLQAQINENLQAELTADQNIEAYFQKRLDLAIKGTDKYTQILGALNQAHSASVSVQAQIDAEAAAAAADAKAKRDERIAEAKKEADDAAAAAKALFNLQKSRLDLRIDAAALTPGIADDVRWNRAEIRFFNAQIKRIEAIRKRRKLTLEEQQAVVDYRSAIIGLRLTIQGLKKDSDKGFSLNELFQEAVNQFNEFGSNVSSSPGTPGSARGALGAAILAQKPGITKADELKLAQAAETNAYLAQILTAIEGAGVAGSPYQVPGKVSDLTPGQITAFEMRRLGRTVRAF